MRLHAGSETEAAHGLAKSSYTSDRKIRVRNFFMRDFWVYGNMAVERAV